MKIRSDILCMISTLTSARWITCIFFIFLWSFKIIIDNTHNDFLYNMLQKHQTSKQLKPNFSVATCLRYNVPALSDRSFTAKQKLHIAWPLGVTDVLACMSDLSNHYVVHAVILLWVAGNRHNDITIRLTRLEEYHHQSTCVRRAWSHRW